MKDVIIEWTKPMTSKEAARYHLTAGFVAVELLKTVNEKRHLLEDWHDLAVDEFTRIATLPDATSEIKGICNRAVKFTRQHIHVIDQMDQARMENKILRDAMQPILKVWRDWGPFGWRPHYKAAIEETLKTLEGFEL
jgi:hypothetical protein